MAVGGYHDSEQKLVEELWDHVPVDALLLEDRGFFSYAHWKKPDSTGLQVLKYRVFVRRHFWHPSSYHGRGCENGRSTEDTAGES